MEWILDITWPAYLNFKVVSNHLFVKSFQFFAIKFDKINLPRLTNDLQNMFLPFPLHVAMIIIYFFSHCFCGNLPTECDSDILQNHAGQNGGCYAHQITEMEALIQWVYISLLWWKKLDLFQKGLGISSLDPTWINCFKGKCKKIILKNQLLPLQHHMWKWHVL